MPHVRTLGAVHLATARFLDPSATCVTRDARTADVATQLGLDTLDPAA